MSSLFHFKGFTILEFTFFNLIQAREFANELRASTKAPKNPAVWLEGSNGSGHNGSSADTSTVSDAYSKMLTIFIPLLVDEVTRFFQLNAAP